MQMYNANAPPPRLGRVVAPAASGGWGICEFCSNCEASLDLDRKMLSLQISCTGISRITCPGVAPASAATGSYWAANTGCQWAGSGWARLAAGRLP